MEKTVKNPFVGGHGTFEHKRSFKKKFKVKLTIFKCPNPCTRVTFPFGGRNGTSNFKSLKLIFGHGVDFFLDGHI